MDFSTAPEELHEFVTWLEENGAHINAESSGPMGYHETVYSQAGSVSVKVIRDRDDSWDLLVGYQEREEWFDAATWNSCLFRQDASLKDTALSSDLAWIRRHWENITRPDRVDIIDCLAQVRKNRAYKSLGLDPDEYAQ